MPRVLFVCPHNAGRSQIAAAWFNALADKTKAQAVSAGTDPAEKIYPEVLSVMRDVGIDLTKARPQPLTDEMARSVQYLISMDCENLAPDVPDLVRIEWEKADANGKSFDELKLLRDEIQEEVTTLMRANGWIDPLKAKRFEAVRKEGM